MKYVYFIVLVIFFSLLAGCAGTGKTPDTSINIEREAKETLITTFDSTNWVPSSLKVSRDGRTVVYTKNVDNKQVVVVNGKEESAKYKQLGAYYVTISPDGKRLAYIVHDDEADSLFAVIDGKEDKPYQDIGIGTPIFSEDSLHVAYTAFSEGKWLVVVDGLEGAKYDAIDSSTFKFSPSGNEVSYKAKTEGKWHIVRGDMKGKPYDDIIAGSLYYSPDGNHLAYCAIRDGMYLVVKDGEEGLEYNNVFLDKNSFSYDSKHFAFLASDMKTGFVVLDGKELTHYWGIGYGSSAFSPDNKRLAYAAILKGCEHTHSEREKDEEAHQAEEEWCIVVDGVEGKIYNIVTPPVFSPDSARIAYFTYSFDKGSEKKSILTPKEKSEPGWVLVVDGVEQKEKYENIGMSTLVFSPDSKHVAFVAKAGDKLTVVVDGKPGKIYDGVVASMLFGGNVSFRADGTLHYVAIEGENVLLVEETITNITTK